jgi:ankyrin repeat protein
MRSRMGRQERAQHDEAWGLDFGDPGQIRLMPEPKKGGGLLQSWFGKKQIDLDEHPMSVNMAQSLQQELAKNPAMVHSTDDNGWTLLHQEALAGSAPTVQVLLAAGADKNARTKDGKTALQLAQALGWEKVVAILTQR